MDQCSLTIESINFVRNFRRQGQQSGSWSNQGNQGNFQGGNSWNNQGNGPTWGIQGSSSSSNIPQRPPGFGNQFQRQEERNVGFEDPILRRIVDMHLETKSINQQNVKTIAEHTRMLDLRDTTLRNIDAREQGR